MENSNTDSAAARLKYLCEVIPPLLEALPEDVFNTRPSEEKWSRKEILGHLIDSAANNHHRFIRVQIENTPFISYDADEWNNAGFYRLSDRKTLIELWRWYNLHIAHIIGHTPASLLSATIDTGGPSAQTLDFVIRDYVNHLEHHLHQLVEYH